MLIELQYPEASKLLWELYYALPEESRERFVERVNKVAYTLHYHPELKHHTVIVGEEFPGNERAEIHKFFCQLETTMVLLGAESLVQGCIAMCAEEESPDWDSLTDDLAHWNSLHHTP